ncbi:RtcB family protein [Patescibacteria group bacterium]|nr:RtcB family protein [Patescibacteria group bacterium]MCG2701904.1 RtcB family protein [Candidatus Parcubacteria bacterium]MBU4265202.1 RtcB family protein [Patescibacteria group bacterium]MBU4390766.1 RtcB family protein [Patescibacteria group bacterium]MBU4396688.1 RtcB family protein [Patescibacteria group bacterium]
MPKIIQTEKLPIKLWADDIEKGAFQQALHLAQLPFAFKHIAIMPDVHQGYGMPIGGVLAVKDTIIPNAVGVDIGCGVSATKTSLKKIDTNTIKKIMNQIRQVIPLGFKHHQKAQDKKLMPPRHSQCQIVDQEYNSALRQLGTLGGGNHFIEILKGNDGFIWIMLHSGSRNLGYKIANFYDQLAIKLNRQWNTKIPEKWELAHLPADSKEGQAYLTEMQYCVDFARINRKLMMDRVISIFYGLVKPKKDFNSVIDIAHNYATLETHFGKKVWLHRKGAVKATKGLIGVIPGSQGTSSYIVEGLGNLESFQSCSHGAGRLMSRNQAIRTLNLEQEKRKLDQKGIIHAIRHVSDLDEASSAYKPIDQVIKDQKDLIKIKVKLSPLAVIKK